MAYRANKGYIGFSKSVNAHFVEEEGKRPYTRITKQWLSDAGIKQPVGFIKYLIRTGFLTSDEWHHTSKIFNETYYYDAKDLAQQINTLIKEKRLQPLLETYKQYPTAKDAILKGLSLTESSIGQVDIWRAFTLDNLQKHLDGNIDILDIPELFGENCTLYVHDEGLYTQTPTRAIYANKAMEQAGYLSQITGDPVKEGELFTIIYGKFIIMGYDPQTGETQSLEPDTLKKIKQYFTDISPQFSGIKERNHLLQLNRQPITQEQALNIIEKNINAVMVYDFVYRDLSNIDLSNHDLRGIRFTGTNLTGANLAEITYHNNNFEYANLTNCNLTNAKLRNVQFQNTNLTGSNLSNSDLTGANLQGANLTGTNFTNACLDDVNFDNIDFTNCNLNGAYILTNSGEKQLVTDILTKKGIPHQQSTPTLKTVTQEAIHSAQTQPETTTNHRKENNR